MLSISHAEDARVTLRPAEVVDDWDDALLYLERTRPADFGVAEHFLTTMLPPRSVSIVAECIDVYVDCGFYEASNECKSNVARALSAFLVMCKDQEFIEHKFDEFYTTHPVSCAYYVLWSYSLPDPAQKRSSCQLFKSICDRFTEDDDALGPGQYYNHHCHIRHSLLILLNASNYLGSLTQREFSIGALQALLVEVLQSLAECSETQNAPIKLSGNLRIPKNPEQKLLSLARILNGEFKIGTIRRRGNIGHPKSDDELDLLPKMPLFVLDDTELFRPKALSESAISLSGALLTDQQVLTLGSIEQLTPTQLEHGINGLSNQSDAESPIVNALRSLLIPGAYYNRQSIQRRIQGCYNALAKQNNPLPIRPHIYSLQECLYFLTQIEAVQPPLAPILLLSMVTGLSLKRIVRLASSEDALRDGICYTPGSDLIRYRVKHIIASQQANKVMALVLPGGLVLAVVEALKGFNAGGRILREMGRAYRSVRKQLMRCGIALPLRMSQWAHTHFEVLASSHHPYEQDVISGEVRFMLRSFSAYAQVDISAINTRFQEAYLAVLNQYPDHPVLQRFNKFALTQPQELTSLPGQLGSIYGDQLATQAHYIDRLRKAFRKAKTRANGSKAPFTAHELLNLLNLQEVNYRHLFSLYTVARGHMQRLQLIPSQVGFLVQDKDSKHYREPRLCASLALSDERSHPVLIQWRALLETRDALCHTLEIDAPTIRHAERFVPTLTSLVYREGGWHCTVARHSIKREQQLSACGKILPESPLPANIYRHLVATHGLNRLTAPVLANLLGHNVPGFELWHENSAALSQCVQMQRTFLNELASALGLKPLRVDLSKQEETA